MHSKGKGIADSALPFKRTPASWLKLSAAEIEAEGAFCRGARSGVGARLPCAGAPPGPPPPPV